jgi:hypothetical protein
MKFVSSAESPDALTLQAPTTVCLPTFGIIRLIIIRVAVGKRIKAYYDTWPVYGKILVRWCRVPARTLERLFSALLRLEIRRVADSDSFRGSPQRNLSAMKLVVTLQQKLRPEIDGSGWLSLLSEVIGARPALAYYHRRFPALEIWPSVIAGAICKDRVPEDEQITLAWPADWPESWRQIVDQGLASLGIKTFRWPSWYRFVVSGLTAIRGGGRVFGTTLACLARHGWPARETTPEQIPAVIEFIEHARMQGQPVDTNFFEDGEKLRRWDILYFLTPGQVRLLKRHGKSAREEVAKAKADGFRVVELSRLKYSWSTVQFAARELRQLVRCFSLRRACLARTFWFGWRDYFTQVGLFDTYKPQNYLHTMAPNGSTGLRLDSAIVTGLCRKYQSRSVGYQNRSIYDSVYEDCFDCYDLYLAWGETWRTVLGAGNEFIKEVVVVGCQNNDGMVGDKSAMLARDSGPPLVAVFPSDLGGSLYPKTSTLNLLETCIDLAKTHTGWQFRIKMKDPAMVDVVLADAALARRYAEVENNNFQFLRLARHDCAGTISQSDVVIGAAWTTPASDALLLGKRVIFYDEFNAGGAAFDGLPHLVAKSRAELKELFNIATADYRDYAARNENLLARLDPFRDGNARSRIVHLLLAVERQNQHHMRAIASPRPPGINDRVPLERAG